MKNSQPVLNTLPIFTFDQLSNQHSSNLFQTGMPLFNQVGITLFTGTARNFLLPRKKRNKEEANRLRFIDIYLSISGYS